MKVSLAWVRVPIAVMTATLLVLSLFVLIAGPVGAAHVTPEFSPGAPNKTCGDFEGEGQDWIEFKIDESGNITNGIYTDGTLSVTISNMSDQKTFDWSSNIGVDAVFVKAGSAGSNLYRYDPPAESTGDTGLTSPGTDTTNQISHISFCYDLGEGTTTTTEGTTTTTEGTTTTTEGTTTTTEGTTTTTEGTTTTTEGTTTTTEGTTTTTEGTTTTTEGTTTTTEGTTTTTEGTTTTTEGTTTTTLPDEVGGIVITTTSTTTAATSSTVGDTVLGTEVLPFTGSDSGMLTMLAVSLLGLGLLIVLATRRIEE